MPQGLGVRQSYTDFDRGTRSKSSRGLPPSKTLPQPRKRESVHGPNACATPKEALHDPYVIPLELGVRQSSTAFDRGTRSKSGRGLPQSKTLPRPRKRESVHGPNAGPSRKEVPHKPRSSRREEALTFFPKQYEPPHVGCYEGVKAKIPSAARCCRCCGNCRHS